MYFCFPPFLLTPLMRSYHYSFSVSLPVLLSMIMQLHAQNKVIHSLTIIGFMSFDITYKIKHHCLHNLLFNHYSEKYIFKRGSDSPTL
ncbi:hypothetical protein BDB01DRAFT_800353 [Pilobolus umbonatus]|nr:hypothetical protein BDB01DRAFT_800353 [Pilobolus umbonatus]